MLIKSFLDQEVEPVTRTGIIHREKGGARNMDREMHRKESGGGHSNSHSFLVWDK